MAALTAARVLLVPRGTLKKAVFPLAAITCYANGMACYDSSAYGYITKGAVATTLTPVGLFTDTVINGGAAGSVSVGVDLDREHYVSYWDSVTGAGAITIANLFQPVYIADDHTVTTVTTGASVAGRVWSFAPQGYPLGVGVEMGFSDSFTV